MSSRPIFSAVLLALFASLVPAAPLSKTQPIDFYRDVPSRSLHGAATRSDGRLIRGPEVTSLKLPATAPLLWALANDGDKLLVGTGPDGRLLSIAPDLQGEGKVETLLDLPETHVFAALRLPNGDLLAGTSPQGTLVLARAGQVLARTALPVDSIFDLVVLPDSAQPAVLVATGNPGRIYRVDLTTFATSGDHEAKLTATAALAARGIMQWGEIRDRNVRRLLRLADGRVIAGSAPKGNVYEFAATGGTPRILAENRGAEVCDLLPWDGGFYAALTFAAANREGRVNRPVKPAAKADDAAEGPAAPDSDTPPAVAPVEPAQPERFGGRSQLLWFPDGGFPETVATRGNMAFYRLARQGGRILIAGGEQGELLGYDPTAQRSLTYAGAASSQLNGLVPVPGKPNAFYAIGNNAAELTLINFPATLAASAETRRIDLGLPATIGQLQLGTASTAASADLSVELRTSFGSDETEGWTAWQAATAQDGGWLVPGLRGRYVQLRLTARAADFAIDKAELNYLAQNRRPQLQDFRIISPHYALIPAPESTPPVSTTLGQLLSNSSRDDDKRRNPLYASQVVPQPGTQLVVWTVSDPDDDNVLSTFSIRPTGTETWTDLAVATPDAYAQFDISHLAEGVYQTRVVATESAPRPVADRLSATFETDSLLVDRSPPVITASAVRRADGRVFITVRAKDALSLLAGAEFTLNNGLHEIVEHPADGILDGRDESFIWDLPESKASGATSVEIIVYDRAQNSVAQRLALTP